MEFLKTDIEIAQESTMLPIINIAQSLGLSEDDIELMANISKSVPGRVGKSEKPAVRQIDFSNGHHSYSGREGKTTTTVGLGQL
jgi:formate--tetrahydrofolate ligase